MSPDLIATLIDIAIGLGAFIGMVGAPLLVFRRRIAAFWTRLGGIPAAMDRVETAVHNVQMELSLVASAQRVMLDANVDVATFETDADGRNILVNSTYARWLGCDKADLAGWRFLNYVHPGDQDRVREELALAREEVRPYRIPHRLVTSSGKVFDVEKTGSPIPDPGVPVKWIGMVRKVNADT